MKRIAVLLSLSLAAAAPAQGQLDPCVGIHRYTFQELTWLQLDWHWLHVRWFQHIELVPYAGGVGLMVFSHIGPLDTRIAGATRAWLSSVPECPSQGVTLVGMWWDDRLGYQEDGDRMQLGDYRGPIIDLYQEPTGFRILNTRYPQGWQGSHMDPRITRRIYHSRNYLLNHPHYWAILIAPDRGWW